MALKFIPLGVVTVTSAGTAVALPSSLPASSILIQADELNAGNIYVADSTVDSTNGYTIREGGDLPLTGDMIRGITEGFIMSDIFIDADTNGNVARVFFVTRRTVGG